MNALAWARRKWKWLLVIVPVGVIVALSAGTYIYIHFLAPDPAPRLAFSSVASSQASVADGSPAAAPASFDGTWTVTTGSTAQYRVQEVLNGQNNEATGTTTAITGHLQLSGINVTSASFTVDLTKVSSNESRRDNQFRNRIMNTTQYPTATFELTSPIALTTIPDNLVQITVHATGNLTLHGTTKAVAFDLKARRNGATIEINATIPITFSDYGIPNPSAGPIKVGNSGDLEILFVLASS